MTTMDFFGHQEQARRATGRMLWLFAAAVLAITLCIYAAAMLLLGISGERPAQLVDWPVLLGVAAVTTAIIGAAMAFKTAQLRSGGSKVATLLGGRPVPIDTVDHQERMLRNLVEEMSIASGVPVPAIFVLDGETGINAFAAGWSPVDAAVAVTRGALDGLTRDELQGVIAHEFSHVFHGDMRLNIRLMGVLFGIVCITTIGRVLLRSAPRTRSSNNRGGGGIVVFGLALVVIGALGVLFARLIQAAVSRQREFLADASAVQYTRNPRGIGLALAKIGGYGAVLATPHAEEASHMLFADGMRRFASGALATHPPIAERIERVLPGFKRQLAGAKDQVAAANATPAPAVAGAAGFAGAAPAARRSVTPEQLVGAIGDPSAQAVSAAHDLLEALPLELAAAAHDQQRATALVIALLLDPDAARERQQLQLLDAIDHGLHHEARVLHGTLRGLDRTMRLPLLGMAMPALRALPAEQQRALCDKARRLALADDALTPFEFALLKMLDRHVQPAGARPPQRQRAEALASCLPAASVVLSAIAYAGAGDPAAAGRAFAQGFATLQVGGGAALLPRDQCTWRQLDRAIDDLAKVSPAGKRNLLMACAQAAAADGRLEPDEVDMLRALGQLWDCPVPILAG